MESEAGEISQRTEEFTTAKNLLNAVGDAAERIMTSYKDVGLIYTYFFITRIIRNLKIER